MNYYFAKKNTILKKPLRRGIKYILSSKKSLFFSGDELFGTIDDFLQTVTDDVIDSIELTEIEESDLKKLLSAIGNKIVESTVFHNKGSIDSFVHMTAVRKISFFSDAATIALWDTSKNPLLDTLILNLSSCTALENISLLAGSCILNLELNSGGISLKRPVSIPLFDPDILKSMEKLKRAEIYTLPPSDPIDALTKLSRLTNLEHLALYKNNFTFAQFAWLKSKLPTTCGFGGITEFYPDRENDTHMMLISGSDRSDLPIAEEENVHREFDRLCSLYINEDFPPTK